MSTLAQDLEPLKLAVRRYRSDMLEAMRKGDAERVRTQFEQGCAVINSAFELLSQYGEPDRTREERAGAAESDVARELADMWGIRGGLYRAHGDVDDAIAAYDKGYNYEAAGRFRILSSYNTVNRLVLRILENPALLSSDAPVQDLGLTMSKLLDEAAHIVERQLDNGRPDKAWALADIAMVELLTRSVSARATIDDLIAETENDRYPLQSMLNVIRDLLRKKDLANREDLLEAGRTLQSALPESSRGSPL